MGKGSKSSKVKETQAERANAEVSLAKWNRYKDMYRGVESDFINQVSQDNSALLRGRAIADVSQASDGAVGQSVALNNGTVAGLGAMAKNLGGARMAGSVAANKQDQTLRDKGRLNALGIGQDMAVDARQGLGMAARASHQEAIGKARAQEMENKSRVAAIGQVAGITSGLHGDYKEYMKKYPNTGTFGGWIKGS
jgi:hypothetical protein